MARRHSPGEALTTDEIEAIVGNEILSSVGYIDGSIAQERANALKYYRQEQYGNEQKIDTYEQAIMRPINVGMCSELAHALGEAANAPLVISVGGKRMMVDGHISVEPIGGSIILKLAGHIAKQNPPKEKAVKESK